ncbi:MAG TPA: VanW family protein [Pyrinomonadaceae bacterium]|nr:VanW family protein [Pyrinomonadaceae bacterium]
MRDTPTLGDALIFRAKATLLQLKRAAHNTRRNGTARFPVNNRPSNEPVIAESRTPLWSDGADEEKYLLAGKIHNLRLALRRLNGAEIPAGGVFSFWTQIGRAGSWKGYVAGRELREGCIIPSIGGGLCQLSNALYDTALSAGFEIVERHAHTRVVPGSLAEVGRDATVFWNYVDLRFKSSSGFRIEATMDANLLIVRFKSNTKQHGSSQKRIRINADSSAPQSCVTCDAFDCFRHVERKANGFGRSAYLVDEYSPEFNGYILEVRDEDDLLAIPLDGKKYGKANYAWTTGGFRHVHQSRIITLLRAYKSRKLALQGAARQRALLEYSERLATSYSALLDYDITHLTVSQNLLPFLWRDGYLGGRTFDVLMTAMPVARLHERLDAAFALHPESKTLADFRADEWLARAESEALQNARRIITPHSEIAALYKDKARLLDWSMPDRKPQPKRTAARTIAFPASTLGRKGAYELRAAVQGLDVKVVTMGAQLEGPDFWHGTAVENRTNGKHWLEAVDLVVLPAFVEHKPRRLLDAVANGTPVIASTACGLEHVQGVINVPAGNVEALRAEIERALTISGASLECGGLAPLC